MYKILIVEDEEFLRKGLRYTYDYEALQCHVCDEATNGLEAIEKMNEKSFDIIITDIRMPLCDGIELMKRTSEQVCSYIILSGYNDFEYARKSLELGASSYLLKPVNEEELYQALEKAIEDLNKKNIYNLLQEKKEKITEVNVLDVYSGNEKDVVVEEMKAYVRDHYHEKFTITAIVEHLHYSETLLQRKFKKVMGTTFHTYLNRYRIQKAIEYLREERALGEIAALCGFADYKYFSSVFNKYVGASPKNFIQSLEKK